ncbi:hypothetical protein LEM8419_03149 [Neolewinella maritima]|uniref:DUF998 domain-containing protein n=1 Tax=Neolewinella maritima TaxID=1383882 RepID=A0ABM9B4Q5_9BACT|nr:hypothetical protein [Neolewinella maritima]CAH1002231.1 hypothetical protein LEM8419_03149 [Neolewinella maritima]
MNNSFLRGLYVLSADRFRRLRTAILVGTLLTVSLLALAIVGKVAFEIPFEELFRDALVVAEAPEYYGAMSQIGLFLWWVTMGALGVLVVVQAPRRSPLRKLVPPALAATLILAIDDAFMLHEAYPTLGFGIPSTIAVYGGAIGVYLLKHWVLILRSPFPLLLLSLAFLGSSMAFDEIPKRELLLPKEAVFFIEDGLKLAGIVFWSAYHLLLSRDVLYQETFSARMRQIDRSNPGRRPVRMPRARSVRRAV